MKKDNTDLEEIISQLPTSESGQYDYQEVLKAMTIIQQQLLNQIEQQLLNQIEELTKELQSKITQLNKTKLICKKH